MNATFYIRGFNGLRAISILLVVLNHAGWFEGAPHNFFWQERVWRLISGEAGVNLFFAISGFLITFLLLREWEERGRINFTYFFIRRFLRLMPPLFAFLTVAYILGAANVISVHPLAMIAALIYLYNYLPQRWNTPELTHTWSLGVEEQFYLTWPFVVHLFRRNKYLLFCIAMMIISVLLIYIFPRISWKGAEKIYYLTESFRPFRWILPAALPIIAGAMTAYLNFYGKWNFGREIIMLCWLFYSSALFLPGSFLSYYLLFQALAFGILVSEVYRFQNFPIVNFLEWKPVMFIGVISYSIYIWQGLFLRTGPGSDLWFQQFPVNVFFTFSAAILSYYLLEKPLAGFRARYR